MRAYKFLDARGRAPFSGAEWAPLRWVTAHQVAMCRVGVHGCHSADLAYWLADALWEVELLDDIEEAPHKVAASRGRLVGEIEGYPVAVRELAEVGAWRSRERAVSALVAADEGTLATACSEAASLEDLAAVGELTDDSSGARTAAALAADAAHFALHGGPSQSPFVAACAAGHAAEDPDGTGFDAGYRAERAFQSTWLCERLGLDR